MPLLRELVRELRLSRPNYGALATETVTASAGRGGGAGESDGLADDDHVHDTRRVGVVSRRVSSALLFAHVAYTSGFAPVTRRDTDRHLFLTTVRAGGGLHLIVAVDRATTAQWRAFKAVAVGPALAVPLRAAAAARRSFAEHLIATKAPRCTATAWILIVA